MCNEHFLVYIEVIKQQQQQQQQQLWQLVLSPFPRRYECLFRGALDPGGHVFAATIPLPFACYGAWLLDSNENGRSCASADLLKKKQY